VEEGNKLPEPLERKMREMLDVQQSEPELVMRIIERASRRRRQREALYSVLRRLGPLVYDEMKRRGLLHPVPQPLSDETSYGVDGSRQVVGGRLGRYYIFLSTTLVTLPRGLRSTRINIVFPGVDIIEVVDPTGASTEAAAEAAMMVLETLTLRKLANVEPGLVFIDGPIVDPPARLDPSNSVQAVRELLNAPAEEVLRIVEEYHRLRARILAELVGHGHTVVGLVKRIGQVSILSSHLAKIGINIDGYVGDEDLVLALTATTKSRGNGVFYTEPVEATSLPQDVYREYRVAGLRVYASYTFSRHTLRPYRIEVAVTQGADPGEVIKRVAAAAHGLTVPGQSYPLPVVLAHEKSRIRRGLAKLVYREVLTRASLPEGDPLADTLKALLIKLDDES